MAGVGSVMRRCYFSIYNLVAFLGWAQVLYCAALALLQRRPEAVYSAIQRPLLFAQTAALMENLHSFLGLVRSPVSSTLPQVGGRLFVTWGVLWSFPETRSNIFVTSLILSWSIIEVIRYPFLGMKETFGFAPSWLVWLRYSAFIVLYPIGLVSELGLIYAALPYMKASEKYCLRMPNKWNLTFDYSYASAVIMCIYPPGFVHLYRYMFARRKKVLSKPKTA